MVHGSSDSSCSQLIDRACRILGLAEGLFKATSTDDFVSSIEGFDEWVVYNLDGFEEEEPKILGIKPLLFHLSRGHLRKSGKEK